MEEHKKKTKVKKGWLAVLVGLDGGGEGDGGFRRFVIPIGYLYHPLFQRLLERSREIYGYDASGPLRLPCSVDEFLHLRWQIEKGANGSHHPHHHHHNLFPAALSFYPC